ncbi:MAG: hypothetical protein AMXMBFR13_37780 [Phycisphaerae bacterium]
MRYWIYCSRVGLVPFAGGLLMMASSGWAEEAREASTLQGHSDVQRVAARITMSALALLDNQPVDVLRLCTQIDALPAEFSGVDQMVPLLGRLLVDQRNVRIEAGAVLTGRPPQDVLRSCVIRAFGRFRRPSALPFLHEAYAAGEGVRQEHLAQVIAELGGTLPAVRPRPEHPAGAGDLQSLHAELADAMVRSATQKEPADVADLVARVEDLPADCAGRKALVEAGAKLRRMEMPKLAESVKTEELTGARLDFVIDSIGKLGGPEDASLIVDRIRMGHVDWITRHKALKALGRLGGREAQTFLLAELSKPAPAGRALNDSGEPEAVLRSQAALSLGSCGDEAAREVLLRLALDTTQPERVRQAARRSADGIRKRVEQDSQSRRQP